VADIFRRHGEAWRTSNADHLNLAQRRVMTAIEASKMCIIRRSGTICFAAILPTTRLAKR
jgi:hypothetical protein